MPCPSRRSSAFASARGHAFEGEDRLRARVIEALMCDFRVDTAEIIARFGIARETLDALFAKVNASFDGLLRHNSEGLEIPLAMRPLTRLVAAGFDAYGMDAARHSAAI